MAATVGTFIRSGGWDQSYYLAQVSSVIEDRDLDLRNDLLHLRNDPLETRRLLSATRGDGTLLNTFTVGPVLFWSPVYVAGLAVRGLTHSADGRLPERWTTVQFAALHLLSLLLVLYVLWFLGRWVRRAGAAPHLAPLCAVALLLGSPLLVYGFVSYTFTHLLSAAAACWFLAAVLDFDRRPTLGRSLTCGVALGLVFLARWQGIAIALVLVIPFARLVRHPARLTEWRRALILAAGLGGAALLMASLQLRAWHLELGQWIILPQGAGYMHWSHPEWRLFLLSGVSGLLPWSPIFAVGIVGLILPWRLRLSPAWRWLALALLLFDMYLNAAVSDWWGGESYGARRMTADLPWIALGLANLAPLASKMSRRRWLAAGLVLLCGYGLFTANCFRRGLRDLALIFPGTASYAPGAERDATEVRDSNAAREIARSSPINITHSDYFSPIPDKATDSGRPITLAIVLAVLISGAMILQRARPDAALGAVMAAAAGGVVLLHVWLCFGEHPDRGERREWQALIERSRSVQLDVDAVRDSPATLEATLPTELRDPYRYLAAFDAYREGRGPQADAALAGLAAKGYPPAREMLLRTRRDDGGALARLVPGPFLEPRRGQTQRRVALPTTPPHVRVEFDLLLGDLAPGRRYPMALILDPEGAALSVGIDGDGTLWIEPRNGAPERTSGILARQRYAFALEWDSPSGLARLSAETPARERLELRVQARPGGLPADSVVLGRSPGKTTGDPLWGATFADLRVITFATPNS
ncbi:MAG: hypothetical protein ABI609_17490 [Acidobacteriota bacterium]